MLIIYVTEHSRTVGYIISGGHKMDLYPLSINWFCLDFYLFILF